MKIQFNHLPEVVLHKFYEGEGDLKANMFQDENNKIMYGSLDSGTSIGLHTHSKNSEIIFVLEGEGNVIYDDEEEVIKVGECHYCPKGHTHSLRNLTNQTLRFLAVVPQHE